MELDVFAYGIARDILGGPILKIELTPPLTVTALMEILKERYPALQELASLAIAVNASYAEADQIIVAGDEVVLIPPVAGG